MRLLDRSGTTPSRPAAAARASTIGRFRRLRARAPALAGSVPCAATVAAALREPAPAPVVAELALSSFFQGHRMRRAQVRRQRVSPTSGSPSFGSTLNTATVRARFGPMKEGYAAADAGQAAAMRRQSTEFRMRGRRGSHRGYRATRHEGRGHLIENPGTIRSTPRLVNQGRIPGRRPAVPFSASAAPAPQGRHRREIQYPWLSAWPRSSPSPDTR